MARALLLIDIQNDFVPGGALAVPNGQEVVPIANQWIAGFASKGDLVLATQDWHPANHSSFISQNPSGGIWPDHCVQNTVGAEFVPGLDVESIQTVVRKGTDPLIDSYSGFFDNDHKKQTELADVLRGAGVDIVYILGLATDYCVKFTALDARKLGFDTNVIIDGCRGIDLQPGDVERSLAEMRDAGVRIQNQGQRGISL
jgi:nicotinamidase/pyrazinamidase